MPNDYHQTLSILQKYISDDDLIADVLGSDDPENANKQILSWLIQKMKKREEMLDFCFQLKQIITSQDLKMIISEIEAGNASDYKCAYVALLFSCICIHMLCF